MTKFAKEVKLQVAGECKYSELTFGTLYRTKGSGNLIMVKVDQMDFGDSIDLFVRGRSSVNPDVVVEYFTIESN